MRAGETSRTKQGRADLGQEHSAKRTTGVARQSAAPAGERSPRPHLCRQFARRRFAEELPAILNRFAEQAKKGDMVALKALITLSGYDKEEAHVPRRRRGQSLAKLLMAELKKTRANLEAAKASQALETASDRGHGGYAAESEATESAE